MTNISATGGAAITTIANGALATNYGVSNAVTGNNGGIVVGLAAGQATGSADVLNFNVTNSGTAGNTKIGLQAVNTTVTANSAGVEAYTLATSGNNFVNFTGTVGAASLTDAKTLTITGNGVNTINVAGLATTSTINASATTGANTINVGATLTSNDAVSGGSSTGDVLRATVSGTVATGLNITGIETLRMDSGAAATLAFASLPGFTSVHIDDAAGATNAVRTLASGGGFSNLNFVGSSSDAAVLNAMTFSGITATGGWTGAADTLAINFRNGGVALTNTVPYTVSNAITVNGVETISVVSENGSTTGVTTLNGITSNTLQTASFSSNGAIAVGVLTTGLSDTDSIASIDFSGTTTTTTASSITVGDIGGSSPVNIMAAASTITAGAGGLTVRFLEEEQSTDVLTFTGGAGIDIFTGANTNNATNAEFTGIVIASLAGGNDIFRAGNSATVQVDGGSGRDTIVTGAGSDRITGGTGADTLTGGAGVDTFVFRSGDMVAATTSAGTGSGTVTFGNGVDTITDFADAAAGQINSSTENDIITFNGVSYTAANFLQFGSATVGSSGFTFTQNSGSTAIQDIFVIQGSYTASTNGFAAGSAPTDIDFLIINYDAAATGTTTVAVTGVQNVVLFDNTAA